MLEDELHPWVRDNLARIVKYVREHELEKEVFWQNFSLADSERLQWMVPGEHFVTVEGDDPFRSLIEERLLEVVDSQPHSRSYMVTPRGFRAVDEDFEIPSRYDTVHLDFHVGDPYTFREIINSQAAIRPAAIAAQVQADLSHESTELKAAIKELTRVLEDIFADRPTILSSLIQLLSLLREAPDAIVKVAPLIAAAMRALGVLE
jgi:hypothetical protein